MATPKATESGLLLNVHAFLPVSYANGPGARAVLWTQGCSLRCPGCCNPQTHSHTPRALVEPCALAEHVLESSRIEGLTVTGGEPFEQPEAVAQLCRAVRQGGLSVMVFTGWIYEFIRSAKDVRVKSLLAQVDLLVDGPFVRELSDAGLRWRGSGNQQIRFLTDRYGPEILRSPAQPEVEARLPADRPLQITGFPDASDVEDLARRLQEEVGIRLKPYPK